jgi:hypothetical protein
VKVHPGNHKGAPANERPVNYKAIFLVVIGFLFFYFLILKESFTKINSKNSEVYQLAIINDQTESPNQKTLNLFKELLTSLQTKYPTNQKQDISNALVISYNFITENGYKDSLLEFTRAFVDYSNKIDTKLNMTIQEALTSFLKSDYQKETQPITPVNQ